MNCPKCGLSDSIYKCCCHYDSIDKIEAKEEIARLIYLVEAIQEKLKEIKARLEEAEEESEYWKRIVRCREY